MIQTVHALSFYVLSIAIVLSTIGMLFSKNIMHSGYWLLSVSVLAAALFYLLDANYIALVQLLVYAGAVSIIVIFAILITVRGRTDATRSRDLSRVALFIALLFCALLIFVIMHLHFYQSAADPVFNLKTFGLVLFSPTGWAFPFEMASTILTVALVGAVLWSGKEDK